MVVALAATQAPTLRRSRRSEGPRAREDGPVSRGTAKEAWSQKSGALSRFMLVAGVCCSIVGRHDVKGLTKFSSWKPSSIAMSAGSQNWFGRKMLPSALPRFRSLAWQVCGRRQAGCSPSAVSLSSMSWIPCTEMLFVFNWNTLSLPT